MTMNNYLGDVEVGDRLFCIVHGWGTVSQAPTTRSDKLIFVSFDNGDRGFFHTCGRLDGWAWRRRRPTLFKTDRGLEYPAIP